VLTVQPVTPDHTGLRRLEELIGPERSSRMRAAAARIRELLDGGTLWHVNSTAAGGGVAEMLRAVLPLYGALGVRVGWLVVGGDERFFATTKRLGVALYGSWGDGGRLGPAERAAYTVALAGTAQQAEALLDRQDVLYLHDHQTAGLAAMLAGRVSAVFWRCHVGVDRHTEASLAGWDFIAPYLSGVDGLVFSIARHVPAWARNRRVAVIPPFLSPFSAKNADLTAEDRAAALVHCGLRQGTVRPWTVSTPEGPVTLCRPARVVGGPVTASGEPLVVQVSRWDRLKDMDGVLTAFVSEVDAGRLALVGPDPDGIPDDIEQHAWFDRCLASWRSLAPAVRRRASLICLPMTDLRENAVLVNAIQRVADVVVQKSLAEGFGLTVTEAMWKHRLVVGSAVGGIREQITHGEDGLLVDDPTDLAAFGAVLASALRGEVDGPALGARAHRRVLDAFLPDREIVGTARLLAGSAP